MTPEVGYASYCFVIKCINEHPNNVLIVDHNELHRFEFGIDHFFNSLRLGLFVQTVQVSDGLFLIELSFDHHRDLSFSDLRRS